MIVGPARRSRNMRMVNMHRIPVNYLWLARELKLVGLMTFL